MIFRRFGITKPTKCVTSEDNREIDIESIKNSILKDTNITIKYIKLAIDEFDIDNLESILRGL